jgi:hypothetical protein
MNNTINNLLYMNERIERVVNSENLCARITENRALDQKIWALGALEAFRGKMVFLGVFWGNSRILEWLEGHGTKDRGSCKVWEFFCGFFECLEWVWTFL